MNGKIVFHVSCISLSYRIRGKVARTQRKHDAMSRALSDRINPDGKSVKGAPGMKRAVVSNLMKRIFKYSAMNKRANFPPPNSMLNPETSSDSPSAKSNGVR